MKKLADTGFPVEMNDPSPSAKTAGKL